MELGGSSNGALERAHSMLDTMTKLTVTFLIEEIQKVSQTQGKTAG